MSDSLYGRPEVEVRRHNGPDCERCNNTRWVNVTNHAGASMPCPDCNPRGECPPPPWRPEEET